jgi:hypothetical protein
MSWRDAIAKTLAEGIRTWHASPYEFNKFESSNIGRGQGAATFGHGIYSAENPKVSGMGGEYWREFTPRVASEISPRGFATREMQTADFDRDKAIKNMEAWLVDHPNSNRNMAALDWLKSDKPVGARVYELNINSDPAQHLDWDKPIKEQSASVQNAAYDLIPRLQDLSAPRGESFYDMLGQQMRGSQGTAREGQQLASEALADRGVPGLRYLDQGSRGPSQPSYQGQFYLPKDTDRVPMSIFNDMQSFDSVNDYLKYLKLTSPTSDLRGEQLKFLENNFDDFGMKPKTSNYVTFDPSTIDIINKYGIAGAAAVPPAIGALAAPDQYEAQ